MSAPTRLCILCLEPNADCVEIFEKAQQNCEIAQVLVDHFWFKIDELSQYPDAICGGCWDAAKAFDTFFKRVQEAHLNYLANANTDIIVQPLEQIKAEYHDESDGDDADQWQTDMECDDLPDDTKSSTKMAKAAAAKRARSHAKADKPAKKRRKGKSADDADTSVAEFAPELQAKMVQWFTMSCDLCEQPFDSWSAARTHYPRTHNVANGYLKCCGKKFANKGAISDHIQYHIDPSTFQCEQCPKRFFERRALASHVLRHLSDEDRNFECYMCHKRYSIQHILKRHFDNAHPLTVTRHTCDICNKNFKSHHILKYHKRKVHELSEQRICDICGKAFKTKEGYEGHVQVHTGTEEPRAQCHYCGVWLKTKKILVKHMRIHTDQPQKCPYCDKIKDNRTSMAHHIRAVHNSTQYPCTICDKVFKRMITLTEHIASHTGQDLYTCPYCPRTFKCNANMHKHRKSVHYDQWVADRVARNIARTTNVS